MSNGILFLPGIMSEGFEKSFAALRLWKDKSMTEIFITVLQIICWTLEQLLNYNFKQLLSLFAFEAYIFIARKVNSKCLLSHKRTLSLILCTLSIATRDRHSRIWFYFLMKLVLLQVILTLNNHSRSIKTR